MTEELLELALEAWRARGQSPVMLSMKRVALLRFFGHLKERGIADLRSAREEDVVSYLAWLRGQRGHRGLLLAHATVERNLSYLRGFFALLVRRGLVLTDPVAGVHLAREERLPRGVLSETQARRLMESPSPKTAVGLRDRAVLEVLYGSGLRLGECMRLDLTDVDLVNGTAFVRDGKGRKDRVVPLSACAIAALETYLRKGRPSLAGRRRESGLFVSMKTGRRLSPAGLHQLVEVHGLRLGTHVHPHALRHTCATHLLRGGASVRHVQKILGHKELRSTMLYTRVDTTDLKRVIERSHPRERRKRRSRR